MRRVFRKRSQYPVGASWSFTAPNGDTGRVWLDRCDDGLEFWRWEWRYSDDSLWRGDWTPSRASAVEECKTKFFYYKGACPGGCRFTRDKERAKEDQS